MKNKTKIIFIDWYKTLSNSLFWEEWKNENHKHNKHYRLIDNFLVEKKDFLYGWMRGKYNSEEMCNILEKESKLPSKIIFDKLKESCEKMTFVSDEIPSLLKKIKEKGTRIILATDNMDTFRRFTMPALRLENLFDDFLISYELKCLKGDLKEETMPFFSSYAEKKKMDFSKAVLLDDNIYSPKICKKIGLKVIKIDGPETILNLLKKYAFNG
jgi:FMN phosphatase YigB (HAD superfamily)